MNERQKIGFECALELLRIEFQEAWNTHKEPAQFANWWDAKVAPATRKILNEWGLLSSTAESKFLIHAERQ